MEMDPSNNNTLPNYINPRFPTAKTHQLPLHKHSKKLLGRFPNPRLFQGMSWSGGDWICSACQNVNFKKRETCNRCGYPKYGGPDPSAYAYQKTEVLAGDWYCTALNCGAHNYASRPNCFKCGAFKSVYAAGYVVASDQYGADGSVPPGWKSGDWMCPRMGCGVHNYASRMECFKCKTPRNFGGAV